MPEYNEEGDNQGFKESNFFAHFGLDNRALFEPDKETDRWFPSFHTGVSVDFLSANIVNCNSSADGVEPDCTPDGKNIDDLSFNDVADTVNASVYLWLHFLQSRSGRSEVGIGGRCGMQSRERLEEDRDSINDFYTLGLHYVFNDFKDLNKKYHSKFRNGMPRFVLEGSAIWYEDYAGLGRPDARVLVLGAYRVKESLPVYIGIAVNGGDGPDEIALTITYGLKADSILGFFK